MAQHDMNIANADGATVRADLNNAFLAGVSLNSGASAPSTTFAYQWWADTTTGLLKIRNAANSAWITVGTLAATNLGLQIVGKGADISSASPLVLGTDGSYFDVTGTTGYSSITVAAGLLFELQFDGVLTMTDGASLDLGGANITTAAGDRVVFFSTAANTVILMAFQREGTPPLGYASQSEMETATAADKAVTPGGQHNHPGHPKAWVAFDGTGTLAVEEDYGVSSVADNGTGDYTVNFDTDFSAATYAVIGIGDRLVGTTHSTEGMQIESRLVGACNLIWVNASPTPTDQNLCCVAFFGDH